MSRERVVCISEPGLPGSSISVRVKEHPLEMDVTTHDVRDRLLRLASLRKRDGRHCFDVTYELVDRVASFAKNGSCPNCDRRDAICLRPDPASCRIAEVMES